MVEEAAVPGALRSFLRACARGSKQGSGRELSTSAARLRLNEILQDWTKAALRPCDEDLAALSLLCSELSALRRPSRRALRLAGTAFDAVNSWRWEPDEFGERVDLLCQFGFLSWRHARGLGLLQESQRWVERYDVTLQTALDEGPTVWPLGAGAVEGNPGSPLVSPDLFMVLASLRRERNSEPRAALELYRTLDRQLTAPDRATPDLFDERSYFSYEVGLGFAHVYRTLGRVAEMQSWLGTAAQRAAGTVEEERCVVETRFCRLALDYEQNRCRSVPPGMTQLIEAAEKLGLNQLALRSRLMRGLIAGDSGDLRRALQEFEVLLQRVQGWMRPWILVAAAQAKLRLGSDLEGGRMLGETIRLARKFRQPVVLSNATGLAAQWLRDRGLYSEAADAYSDAISQLAALGMIGRVAYCRIVLAETLLLLGRHEEAELEIRAALPTIEEQRLVPEGLTALALLRESLRRRKTDRSALRELREHLQGKR